MFTYEKYHNRKQVGSTQIRVHNLLKYWPEASLYKYGEKPDVMVFQKVYTAPDFDFPETLDCIKILDICDPDWLEDKEVKRTVDAVDAVTVPTKALKEFIEQLTDKPVKLIPDRFDLSEFPTKPKTHKGTAKKLVWFGYSHNAKKLKDALPAIIELNLELTIISNKDPSVLMWAEAISLDKKKYKSIKYDQATIYSELAKYDIALLPQGTSPQDRFKSNNKEIIANLCGLPVAKTRKELTDLLDPRVRNRESVKQHAIAKKDYDCIISIREMKELINDLKTWRKRGGH